MRIFGLEYNLFKLCHLVAMGVYLMRKSVVVFFIFLTGCLSHTSIPAGMLTSTEGVDDSTPIQSPLPTYTLLPTNTLLPAASLTPTSEIIRDHILYIKRHASGLRDLYLIDSNDFSQKLSIDIWYTNVAIWSPDGSKIALIGEYKPSQGRAIYVMDANGDHMTQVFYDSDMQLGGSDWSPRLDWSPDSSRIAFLANYKIIYTVNVDGSNLNQLTTTDTTKNDITWSPDGTRIAYSERTDALNDVYNIRVLNIDDDESNAVQLTHNQGWSPVWSPDGSTIAFVSYTSRSDTAGIYLMNADGSNKRLLVNSTTHDLLPTATLDPSTEGVDRGYFDLKGGSSDPKWSPDGTQIAFLSSRYFILGPYNRFALYVINADGTGLINLSAPGDAGSFDWSPDGNWIAFASHQETPYGTNTAVDIYLIHPDGTGLTRITDTPDETELGVSWQPDPH